MRAWVFAPLIVATLMSPPAGAAHDTCTVCHVQDSPQASNAGLVRPLPALCVDCHPERVAPNEHVIGVPPTGNVTGGLPLLNGMVSCTTCHDPHSTIASLTRLPSAQLCLSCHPR